MNKRREKREKRKSARRPKRVKEIEPDYGYSELETSVRSKRPEYKKSSQRRPRDGYHSEYNYNTYEDRYDSWKDVYKPDYRRDQYSTYDSLYDTDDDETYRYPSRGRYNDDYYDDTEYSPYYDQDDTDYTDERPHSAYKTYNKNGVRRQGRMSDDSKYLYRYEEDHPEYRHSHGYNGKNKRYTSTKTDRAKHRNDINIYAMSDIVGQKAFKYKKYDTEEPLTSEVFSETEIDSEYPVHGKRKRKQEYNIYTTETSNNATAFNNKLKSPSPERIISVTDYQEIPMVAFKNKHKRSASLDGESDLVYLPMLVKDNHSAHRRKPKTYSRIRKKAERAEKPLEENITVYRALDSGKHNIFEYKRDKGSDQNINPLNAKRKGITVYTVSSGPSQVFRKSTSKVNQVTNNSTDQIPNRGTSTVRTPNEVTSNEMMDMVQSHSEDITTVPETSIVENKRSMVGGIGTKNASYDRSAKKSSIGATRNKSVARKSSGVSQTSFNSTNTLNTGMEGQNIQKSVIRQSYVPPRSQSVVKERKSLAAGQQRTYSGLPSTNTENQNTPLKGIIKPSMAVPQSQRATKMSYVANQQDLGNDSQFQGTTGSDLEMEGQNPRGSVSRQSVARQSNVLPRKQSSIYNKKSLVSQKPEQQTMPKSLLRQSPKKSVVRQSSIAPRGQSFVDRSQVIGTEEQNTPQSIERQSIVPQTGQSFVDREQIMGTEEKSPKKSSARQSSVARIGQSFVGKKDNSKGPALQSIVGSSGRPSTVAQRDQTFVDRDQIPGIEEQNIQESMERQSGRPQSGQSVVDRDVIMGTEKQTTNKSLVRQSNAAKKNQSFVDRSQILGTERQSTQKSLARQSSVAQRGQSLANRSLGTGIEEQNPHRSIARQSTAPQTGQSFVDRAQMLETQEPQKSYARQSGVAPRGQSFVGRDYVSGIGEQNTQKSIAKQSTVAKRGQSLVARDQIMGTEGQTAQKSMLRQSSIAQRGQTFGETRKSSFVEQQKFDSPLQENDTTGEQPNVSILGQSTVFKGGQQKSSVVGRQSLPGNEEENKSNIKSVSLESNLQQPQRSRAMKRPTKTKSKSLLKRAFSRMGSSSKKHGKDQDSNSSPMLDVILSEAEGLPDSQNQSLPPQPVSEESAESFKQQSISTTSKRSTKSKFSKPFKSLLRRSKKSESKQRQTSNIVDVQPIQKSYVEQKQQYSDLSSEQYPEVDDTLISGEMYYTDYIPSEYANPVGSFHSRDGFPIIINGYDMTKVFHFLNIAQFIIGVTIHDKLMEVFALL